KMRLTTCSAGPLIRPRRLAIRAMSSHRELDATPAPRQEEEMAPPQDVPRVTPAGKAQREARSPEQQGRPGRYFTLTSLFPQMTSLVIPKVLAARRGSKWRQSPSTSFLRGSLPCSEPLETIRASISLREN